MGNRRRLLRYSLTERKSNIACRNSPYIMEDEIIAIYHQIKMRETCGTLDKT